ncbi:hypothetical protein IJH89_02320 [Candidatus Saccharibacteria bacterium]|nr:hypothetical protein [Candidatus Saccharibacteria bacterium]
MNTSVKSVDVIRVDFSGEEVSRKAYIREPMRDEDGRCVVDEANCGQYKFADSSKLRTRMLRDYLRKGVLSDVPMELLFDVRRSFLNYVMSFPFKEEIQFRGVVDDVNKVTCFTSDRTPGGRRVLTLQYLDGYKALRKLETRIRREKAS